MATNESKPLSNFPSGEPAAPTTKSEPANITELVTQIANETVDCIYEDGTLAGIAKATHITAFLRNVEQFKAEIATWDDRKQDAVFQALKDKYDTAKAEDAVGELGRLLDIHVKFEVYIHDQMPKAYAFMTNLSDEVRDAALKKIRKKFDEDVCAGKPGDKQLDRRYREFDLAMTQTLSNAMVQVEFEDRPAELRLPTD